MMGADKKMKIRSARTCLGGLSARRTVAWRIVVLVGCLMAVSACSQVPDAVNPAEWYRSTADAVSGDDAKSSAPDDPDNQLQADRGKAPPGSDDEYPKLSRVDQQVAARDAMAEGLKADTQGRKYDDSIQRQGSAGAKDSLYGDDQPPPAPSVESQSGTPKPQPTKSVADAEPAPTPQPEQQATPKQAAEPSPSPQPAPSTRTASNNTRTAEGVDEGMRDRLARQLAEIRARAADRGSLLPEDLTSGGQGQPTVIVSSGGIETAMAPGMQSPDTGDIPGLEVPQGTSGGTMPQGAATRVATILFANGSSALDGRDRQILGDVARLVKQRGGVLHVVGHASQRTRNMTPDAHARANHEVSVKRAERIVQELTRLGISSSSIRTTAAGDDSPLYLEVMPSGEAGNRRAEIYLSN